MSADLIVSGGGSVAVASDALLGRIRVLEQLADDAHRLRARVEEIDRLVTPAGIDAFDAPVPASHAEHDLDAALSEIARVAGEAEQQAHALRAAAIAYGLADDAVAAAVQAIEAQLAMHVAMLLPFAALLLLNPWGAAVLAAGLTPAGRAWTGAALTAWLGEHARLLTDPLTVAVIRGFVSTLDEAELVRAGVPIALVPLLTEHGLGLTGPATSTATVLGAGMLFGAFRETPVRVIRTSDVSGGAPAAGFAERYARIPSSAAATSAEEGESPSTEPQIRVERYTMPSGEERFEVYIGGTVTFDPVARGEPFDLTSNVTAAAHLPAGSSRAVVDALHAAGATSDSKVVFTGYSQGGLVATQVATSGEFDTAGLVTFGAPTAGFDIGSDYPAVLVQHTDDLVPALAGERSDDGPLVVERRAYDASQPLPDGVAVPAHMRPAYTQTAQLMDGAGSEAITSKADDLAAFSAGAVDTRTTLWRADRVPGGDPPPPAPISPAGLGRAAAR